MGVKATAAQLAIPYYTLSEWRYNRKKYEADLYCGSDHKRISAKSCRTAHPWTGKGKCITEYRRHLVFLHNAEKRKRSSRYQFIFEKHHGKWTMKLMCKILCVSVSGYYKYRRNLGKPNKDTILSAAIQSILDESPYNDNYGVPRMQLALLWRGIKAGIRRIARIMR